MDPSRPDRLPPLEHETMSDEQRAAVREMVAGPRKEVLGPFVPLLRSPELMTRLQRVGAYLRYESCLPDAVFELVVLVVARHWDQQFEWGHHQPLAIRAGVPEEVVVDVAAWRRPVTDRRDLLVGHDVASALLHHGAVDDDSYSRAVDELGEQAFVELVAAVGYYTTLALTMNAACTPSPYAIRLEPPSRAAT